MRTWYLGLLAIPLAALMGCSGTGTPGGLGASGRHGGTGGNAPGHTGANGEHKPIIGKPENSFTLSMPGGLTGTTHIKQGEMKTVKIGVDRAKGFTGEVALKIEDLPKGVTMEPAAPVIKGSDKDITITLKAAPNADVGKVKIMVSGQAKEGPPAENSFELSVDKK
jgi:hypothetical protein